MILATVSVRRATVDDADTIGVLFDEYRQFYEQQPDRTLATDFIPERLQRGESIVLVAGSGDHAMSGFRQLYPTFCSVAAKAARMDLQTARTNAPARALCESLGWELDTTLDTYHLGI